MNDKKFTKWFDINRVLSYDALYNLVMGEGGVGKTYGFKKWAINDFLKNGSQFIYVRRFNTELDTISTFFDDIIINDEFKGLSYDVSGGAFYIDKKICGYYFPMTKATQYKSMPFAFANKLLYDEYIIEDNIHHYLKNEVNTFKRLCETIFRMRSFRAFLFANAISLVNPYNLHFGFTELPYKKDFVRNKEKDAIFYYSQNLEYQKYKSNTRFGKSVDNTEYGNYSVKNIIRDNNMDMVEKKTDCNYFCSLKINKGTLYFYMKKDYSKLYVSNKGDETNRVYSLSASDSSLNVIVTKNIKKNYHLNTIRLAIQYGFLYYDNVIAKNLFKPYLELFL